MAVQCSREKSRDLGESDDNTAFRTKRGTKGGNRLKLLNTADQNHKESQIYHIIGLRPAECLYSILLYTKHTQPQDRAAPLMKFNFSVP